MEIKWIDTPPPMKYFGNKAFYEELKKKPGQWALYRENTFYSYGANFRKIYPNVELTSRHTGNKTEKGTYLYDLYVRYVEETTNA